MTSKELSDRLIDFAVRAGQAADAMPETRLGRHVAGQLVRSATSPAPNYEEGCAAESKADFAHKLSICLKELRESRVWIRMALKAKLLPDTVLLPLLEESDQLCRIIGKSVATAKGCGGQKSAGPQVRAGN